MKRDRQSDIVLRISRDERVSIDRELIDFFCLVDPSCEGKCFSGKRIEKEYPKLWQLYKEVC